jgi:hypothetical protein
MLDIYSFIKEIYNDFYLSILKDDKLPLCYNNFYTEGEIEF